MQRLNQVEASSRAKISFLEQLYRYHKQHGQMRIIVPTINHATLDLWLLRKEVQKLGGFTTVCTPVPLLLYCLTDIPGDRREQVVGH